MVISIPRVRRALALMTVSCCLAIPTTAAAKSFTASAGGVTATLSYSGGPGITTTDERLKITAHGMPAYDRAVPSSGCFKVCSPLSTEQPVQVLDLYGDGEYLVVLNLFTGGADCCGLDLVYAPSASIGSWVVTAHNFGPAGAKPAREGGRWVFLSGDAAFYCTFTFCAGSALPLQIWSFTGDAFHNVTRSYPALIAKDAAGLLSTYDAHPGSQTLGVIAAWAADEDNLGLQATVATVLQRQIADRHLTRSFVSKLKAFLGSHGYGR